MKREFKVQQGKQGRYEVTHWVRSIHEGARYSKIHIRLNILIPGKLRYPATPFPLTYRIKQF